LFNKQAEGLVAEVGRGSSSGGKMPILLDLVDDARHVLGLDLAHDRLRGAVVNLRGAILLLFIDGSLQAVNRGGYFVGGVGVLLEQILHDAHALVKGLLHLGDLLLQLVDLRLQLDDFLAGAVGGSDPDSEEQRQKQRENELNTIGFHS